MPSKRVPGANGVCERTIVRSVPGPSLSAPGRDTSDSMESPNNLRRTKSAAHATR